MSYTVTITKTEEVIVTCGREWKVIGVDAATEKNIFGYTPAYEKIEARSEKIFEQTVAELDVKAVLCAINAMPLPDVVRIDNPFEREICRQSTK